MLSVASTTLDRQDLNRLITNQFILVEQLAQPKWPNSNLTMGTIYGNIFLQPQRQ
jgi:hypothetical protein